MSVEKMRECRYHLLHRTNWKGQDRVREPDLLEQLRAELDGELPGMDPGPQWSKVVEGV